MVKILKIKVGSVYIKGMNEGKPFDVFQEAWEKTSKAGLKYYEIKLPVFVSEVEVKTKVETVKVYDDTIITA